MTDTTPMQSTGDGDITIPLVAEELSVRAREVEVGRVRVHTEIDERIALARADLRNVDVNVERVPVGRVVDAVPAIREEGDTLIIPIVDEELVVTKRLILREEVHVVRRTTIRPFEEAVTLRSTRAVVDRERLPSAPPTTPEGD